VNTVMPGEFAPHERTVIAWPARDALWGPLLVEAKRAYSALARTVSAFEPVTMIANPGSAAEAAEACGSTVDVLELPIDDSWFRDTGPIYVRDGSGVVAGLWTFNGWGGKYVPHDLDAQVGRRWAEAAGHRTRRIDMVLEGGSVTVDGDGWLATTEQCLLHPNRNPSLSRAQIEDRLREELGARDVLWLEHGLTMDDDTDGHVDNVAAFVAPGVLLVQGCADRSLDDHARLAANAERARSAGLVVREVPVLPVIEVAGRTVQSPYLNFYLCNGAAIVPVSGHPDDDEMLGLLAEYLPDREVVGLEVGGTLAYGGGGIHCVTQQVPAAAG
jgi:agmatine deiminase